MAEAAEPAIIEGCAETLGSIVQNEQILRLRGGSDRGVVGREAEQINRDHRLRRQPGALGDRHRAGDALGIDIETLRLDIDENGRGADQRHHFGGGAEGEGRTDHCVAGADALGHQHQLQCVGAAGAAHGVFGAAELRQLRLERPHFRAEDELAMAEHARDRGIDGGPKPAALRGHVDERNHGRVRSLVHANSKPWRRFSRPPRAAPAAVTAP